MKHLTLAAAVALTLLASGCGGEPEQAADTAAETVESAAAEPSEAASEAAAEPSEAASEAASGAGGENVLEGTVGEEGNPDAFTITLTDSSGQDVETLPAGQYTINVNDLSEIHNFHLKGGEVDETTTVPETGEKTFTVDLTAGEYEAICDPHPQMVTSFTVT